MLSCKVGWGIYLMFVGVIRLALGCYNEKTMNLKLHIVNMHRMALERL